MCDDGRAAAEHSVAGEDGAVRRHEERERVTGVTRCADDPDLEPVDLDDVAIDEALGPEAVRRVQSPYAGPDPLPELPRGLRVVTVVMRQEHDCDIPGRLGDRV